MHSPKNPINVMDERTKYGTSDDRLVHAANKLVKIIFDNFHSYTNILTKNIIDKEYKNVSTSRKKLK